MTLTSVALAQQGATGATSDASPTPATIEQGLSLIDFQRYLREIEEQPLWRGTADKEMDYVDGNQLNAEILQKMKAMGIPPAIEPLIGPQVNSVMGFEAKNRKDWRITADGEGQEGQDVADALNHKINQAERQSGADKACSAAFRTQYSVGIGWVEVAREHNPFKFKYRCAVVHRNEIWWDWLAKDPMLTDARWLVRRRWTDVDQAALKFPQHADLIRRVGSSSDWAQQLGLTLDGNTTPALYNAWQAERGWSIEEQEWRDSTQRRVCLFECWYRRWELATVLKAPDGRVVEYDARNPAHVVAVAQGLIKPERVVVPRVFVSMWMGPHKLSDEPSPYPHCHFPYVPFWGFREDRTNVPYGAVRGMVFLQDNINSATSKIRWGLAAVRTERTKGAYAGTDQQFRAMIARPDADIILDQKEMAKPGARFEVKRDFQLNEQQYKMLEDARRGIERLGVPVAFQGREGTARSGIQEQTQVEQAHQSLADLMDNFEDSRRQVGELLLAMEINDLADRQEEVVIEAKPPIPEKRVILNKPERDPATGIAYRSNDVMRTRLKVALEDVPTTSSFRAQQLQAMSEAFKSIPQDLQVVLLPHLLALMDVPNKAAIIQAVLEARSNLTEEQVQERIDRALKDAGHDLKARELDLKYSPEKMAKELEAMDANIRSLDARSRQTLAMMVKAYIEAQFAAVQAAEVITAVPEVSPVADVVLGNAGGLPGDEQPLPQPASGPAPGQIVEKVVSPKTGVGFMPGAAGGPAPGDTTPMTPAEPASPFVGPNHGMTTMRPDSAGPAA